MPVVVVPNENRHVHELQLTSSVETELQFGRTVNSVEIMVLSSTKPVYYTVDGTEAEVAGPSSRVLFPGPNSQTVPVSSWSDAVIRLISAEAAVVSVLT